MTKSNQNRKKSKAIVGLLLSSAVLGATISGIPAAQILFYTPTVYAASSTDLVPGTTIDSGNHDYTAADIQNGEAWTSIGTATAGTTGQLFSTTLVKETSSSAGGALFNGALDMTKPVAFQGNFTASSANKTAVDNAGDSLGFILTPDSLSQITANLPKSTGSNLGIGGLPDALFLGRDFYYNSGTDKNITDPIEIRQTDASGNIATSSSSNLVYQAVSLPDAGTGSKPNVIAEVMGLSWTPTSTNADGTVTGTMTLNVTPKDGSTTSVSSTVTVASSLSLGVIGATGGNYGTMTYSNDSNALANNAFTASKGTSPVTVNYLDAKSNSPIASPSTITANVADQIAVNDADNSSTNGAYSFKAPDIQNYSYASSSPAVTVANNDAANNSINVYYNYVPQELAAITINKDDAGNVLSDTSRYWQVSSSTENVQVSDNGDYNKVTTVIWHMPTVTTVNKDTDGNVLDANTNLNLYDPVSLNNSTVNPVNGDVTITNTYQKHIPNNTINNVTINLDDKGNSLADPTGYAPINKATVTTKVETSPNGDTVTTYTTTYYWHKPVTTYADVDENNSPLSSTAGYTLLRTSQETASNGDKTITRVWKKNAISASPSQPATPSQPASPAVNAPAIMPETSNVEPAVSEPQVVEPAAKSPEKKVEPKKEKAAANTAKSSKASNSEQSSSQSQQVASPAPKKAVGMTPHQKLIKVLKVEASGIGGAVGGMLLSAGAWTLVMRFLPAGFVGFLIAGKRRKKDDDDQGGEK